MENTSNISDSEIDELIPSRSVQFWSILIFQIPSLACTIYLLYHLLFSKKSRQALCNHVIALLLIFTLLVEMIDNPLYLNAYLHHGINSFPSSSMICLLWWLIDYGAYRAITIFFMWASFERHLLIFHHHRFLGTKRKRILFHYIPLGILFIYINAFYIIVVLFYPCENTFDYNYEACGSSPCYREVLWLALWDDLINGTLCTILEAIFTIALLIRVIRTRHRARQHIHWRKHRKMAIQLLSISILSLTITLPQALLTAIEHVIADIKELTSVVDSYLFYLTTFVVLCLPLISFGCSPEFWPKFAFLKQRRRRVVVPFPMNATERQRTMIRPRTALK